MEPKKKFKARLKEFKDDEIHKLDDKTFYIGEYMIYNSDRKGFLCDCKAFMFDDTQDCKHIIRVKLSLSQV